MFKKNNISVVLEQVLPSVVNIFTEEDNSNNKLSYKLYNDSFLNNSFFCTNHSPFLKSNFCKKNEFIKKKTKIFKGNSLGSGVIFNKNGYIITNNHVINNSKIIYVKLYDGRIYQASIIRKDIKIDLAIIQIKNVRDLLPIKISNLNKTSVGEKIIAIGNSYGLENTVTYGIISSLNRNHLGIEYFENFIQIDAAINQGNSGGALLNSEGKLIGINTALFSKNGENIGIGFSIPISIIKIVLNEDSLKNFNNCIYDFNSLNINYNTAKFLNLTPQRGLLIKNIFPFSILYKSYLKLGDIILSINNDKVINFDSFRLAIISNITKKFLDFKIIRGNYFKIIHYPLVIKSFKVKRYFSIKDILNKNIFFLLIKDNKFFLKINFLKEKNWLYFCGFKKQDLIFSINNYNLISINFVKWISIVNKKSLFLNIQRDQNFLFFIIEN